MNPDPVWRHKVKLYDIISRFLSNLQVYTRLSSFQEKSALSNIKICSQVTPYRTSISGLIFIASVSRIV